MAAAYLRPRCADCEAPSSTYRPAARIGETVIGCTDQTKPRRDRLEFSFAPTKQAYSCS